MSVATSTLPTNLRDLLAEGWVSKSVKQELRDNFLRALESGEELFPGIVGYNDTVIPEINIAILAGHDMLFLGEKGQAKSRLMRNLVRFLDPVVPFLDIPGTPFHEDPLNPLRSVAKRFLAAHDPSEVPIGGGPREDRYAERLAPGTKFADLIGEID
ncbi:MAG: magnesium chelatase, partial [Planctomycetota bacterium]